MCNGVRVEKGMSVEVVTPTTSNPINNPQGRKQIADAFMRKYDVDLQKAGMILSSYLDSQMSRLLAISKLSKKRARPATAIPIAVCQAGPSG
jgi:hypothetical protein